MCYVQYMKRYEDLTNFKIQKLHSEVTKRDNENSILYDWVTRQIQQ